MTRHDTTKSIKIIIIIIIHNHGTLYRMTETRRNRLSSGRREQRGGGGAREKGGEVETAQNFQVFLVGVELLTARDDVRPAEEEDC